MQIAPADLFAELTGLFQKKGVDFSLNDDGLSSEELADYLAGELTLLVSAGDVQFGLEIAEASEKYALSSSRLDEARAELLSRTGREHEALSMWERAGTRDGWVLQHVRGLAGSVEPKAFAARIESLPVTADWTCRQVDERGDEAFDSWLVREIEVCRATGRRDLSAVLVSELAAMADASFPGVESDENGEAPGDFPDADGEHFSGIDSRSPAVDAETLLLSLRNICREAGVEPANLPVELLADPSVSPADLITPLLNEAIALRNKGLVEVSLKLLDGAISQGVDSIWIRDNKVRAFIALSHFQDAHRELRSMRAEFANDPQAEKIAAGLEKIIQANGLTKADLEEINDYLRESAQPVFFTRAEIERGLSKVELNAWLATFVDDHKETLSYPILKAVFSLGKSTSYLNETFARAIRKSGRDVSYEFFGLEDRDIFGFSGFDQRESAGEAWSPIDGFTEAGAAAVISALIQCGHENRLSPADLDPDRGRASRLRSALLSKTQEALHFELHRNEVREENTRLLIDCLADYLGDSAAERDINICRLHLACNRPAEARALAESRLFESGKLKGAFREIIGASYELQKVVSFREGLKSLSFLHLLASDITSVLSSASTIRDLINVGVKAAHQASHVLDCNAALQLLGVLEAELERAPELVECRARILMANRRYGDAAEVLREQCRFLNSEQRDRFLELMKECRENLRIRRVYETIENKLKGPLSRAVVTDAWSAIFRARAVGQDLVRLEDRFSQGLAYYGARTLELTKSLSDPGAIFEIPGFSATPLPRLLREEPGRKYKDFYPPEESFNMGLMPHNPLVSIIIVAFNSVEDLARLLPTLRDQSYGYFEVILVDNGSDNSRAVMSEHFPDHKYQREDNVGFAEANNVGLSLAEGELILLLNPDTKLDRDALSELVEALRIDGTAAVAVPKIHFDGRFANLRIGVSDNSVSLVRSSLTEGASYGKSFIRQGRTSENGLIQPVDGYIDVDLPVPEKPREIRLRFEFKDCAPHSFDVSLSANGKTRVVRRVTETGLLDFSWGAGEEGTFHVINNVGSSFSSTGMPFDRGFGERDKGQFDGRVYVDALCGCCALIRRAALLRRKVFVPYFFAYYEDSELSYWLKQNRMRILYVPSSRIAHRHSESTTEFSPLWRMLVGRSSLLFNGLKDNVAPDERSFSVIESLYRSFGPKYPALVERLRSFDVDAKARDLAAAVSAPRISVGVYNSYFSSKGGGERHCLELAARLSSVDNVDLYLVSEEDFSIPALAEFFQIDLSKCRKMIVGEVGSCLTSFFDVFINSTYMSGLVSHARTSFFITSFPGEKANPAFLESYFFLHNSPFTAAWANAFWGEHRSLTLLPIIGFDGGRPPTVRKKRVILNVGRFNYGGHCKNQHVILAAFIALTKAGEINEDWTLRLIGAVDETTPTSVRHHAEVVEMAKGFNVEVHANADASFVRRSYAEAAIYCHATGCGLLESDEPALHEHFGIAVFEALMNGCIPCVASTAGPFAMTRGLDPAAYFSDAATLQTALRQSVRLAEDSEISAKAQRAIRKRADELLKHNAVAVNLVADLIELSFAQDVVDLTNEG